MRRFVYNKKIKVKIYKSGKQYLDLNKYPIKKQDKIYI